jgi:hypothetical protein
VSELLDAAAKARTLTGQVHDAVDDWEICGRLPGPASPASMRQAQTALRQIDEAILLLLTVRDMWGREIRDTPAAEQVAQESDGQLGLVVPEG